MLKIYALDYYRLTNGEHSSLMDVVKGSFKMFPIVPESFPRAVELFLDAVKDEHRAMQHKDRPLQSAAIQTADMERVKCFRMLRDWTKLKLMEDDESIVTAAKMIINVSNHVGGAKISSQSVDARTASLTIFIQRLEDDYYDDVVTLGLQPSFDLLKGANSHFMEAQTGRTISDAEYGLAATKRARKNCDFTLKTLFQLIQDKLRLGEGEEFEDYVKFINTEIDKYRISLGQGHGNSRPKRHSKAKEEETEEVEETDVDVEVNEE